MTPLKIGIVEDDLLVGKSIFVMLKKIGYTPIKPVKTYAAALQMVKDEAPDLLIIDIVLQNDPDGIALAGVVNSQYHIPFIFLTANSDEATINRAKQVSPFAYLVKPFYERDLYSSIEIAFGNFSQKQQLSENKQQANPSLHDFLFVKEGTTFHKVSLSDILYIESDHVYLNIYTGQKNYLVRSKLDEFMQTYSQANLVRVHRSYAVNPRHLDSINDLSVTIGKKEIPVNQNYRKDILAGINHLK